MTLLRFTGPDETYLQLAWWLGYFCHRYLTRQVNCFVEQDPKRGRRKREIRRLIELRIVVNEKPESRDKQLGVRFVILKAHLPRPLHNCFAGAN